MASSPRWSGGAAEAVLRLVDAGAPGGEVSMEELGSRIVGLAGRLAAATCEWLLLVAHFDAREGCARFGLASTARWLTHCCGVSHRTAVEQVRVARAVAAFPVLAAAMRAGRVSYSHVRAIARVAKPGEQQLVSELVEVAQSGTVGQLETIVRGLRTVQDLSGGQDGPPAEYVRTGWSSASQWQLSARLDPERGAVVGAAIEAMRAAEDLSPVEALERIAEIALVVLAQAGQAPVLRGDERAAVVVHLDLAAARSALARRDSSTPTEQAAQPATQRATQPAEVPAPEPPPDAAPAAGSAVGVSGRRWRGRIADGPGLPDAVVERLVCAGRLRTTLYREDGSMFDLGRTRRLVSTRLLRALRERDGGCAHPGCGSRDGLEAHHVRHWLDGGCTDLANLVLLCRWHHHAHHRGEFSIGVGAGGGFVFRRPDGRVLQRHVDPSRRMPGVPDPMTTPTQDPRWTGTGQRLDRHWAIAVLAQRREDDAERRRTNDVERQQDATRLAS